MEERGIESLEENGGRVEEMEERGIQSLKANWEEVGKKRRGGE